MRKDVTNHTPSAVRSLEGHDEWSAIDSTKDPIKLLKAIQSVMCGQQTHQHLPLTLHQSMQGIVNVVTLPPHWHSQHPVVLQAAVQPACQPPAVDHHPNLSDLEVCSKFMERKKSKKQRGDPRMSQALAVCLEDPDQSHLDVLFQCRFDFSPLSREELKLAGSRDVKDVENITLKQRFDQLSRRLRNAREWIKREREEGKLVASTNNGPTEQTQIESSDNDSKINDKLEGTIGSNMAPDGNNGASSSLSTAQKRRRDSFDEAIDELPGMEGLGDTLIEARLSDAY